MTTSLLPHARELVSKGLLDPESGQLLEMVRMAAEGVVDQGGARWVLERLKGGGHVIVRAAPDPWSGKPAAFILTPEDEDDYLQGLSRVRQVAKGSPGVRLAGELEWLTLEHLAGNGAAVMKRCAEVVTK